jgi:uncharacterized protein
MRRSARFARLHSVDFNSMKTYYFPVMSVTLPESVDAWRMVSARRSFQGSLPIAAMPRLCEVLADEAGLATYELDFGRDEYGTAYVDVRVQAPLWLVCQRTLEPFVLPVTVDSRLGLIRSEREEAALPPGCEPLLIAEDDKLNPIDVIEDELLLALPLVPVNPDSELPEELMRPPAEETSVQERPDNPFAVLRELKKT